MLNIQIRGTRGEHTESEGGVYDVSNKRRLGVTEREVVSEMRNGVLEMIDQTGEATGGTKLVISDVSLGWLVEGWLEVVEHSIVASISLITFDSVPRRSL